MILILLALFSFDAKMDLPIYRVCGLERIVSTFDTLPIRYSGIRHKISSKNDQIDFLIRENRVSVSKSALVRSINEDRECSRILHKIDTLKMTGISVDTIMTLSNKRISDQNNEFLLQYYLSIAALRDGVCIRSKENSRCSQLNSHLIEQHDGGYTASDPRPPRIHNFLCIIRIEDDAECTLLAPWDFYRRGGERRRGLFDDF